MNLHSELSRVIQGELRQDEPLSNHTSLGIGGPAAAMFLPRSRDDLTAALSVAQRFDLPWLVIGNGTNLLVSDDGFPGLVIKMTGLDRIQFEGGLLTAEAGAALPALLAAAVRRSLTGLEFVTGIPGTVGGAAVMNAGTRGESLAERLIAVEGIFASGEPVTLDRSQLNPGYRNMNLPEGFIVASARFGLMPGDRKEIQDRIRALADERKARQPVGEASAGCIFKNPPGDAAGRLIELAGCKGLRVGGAEVSRKHANFIINRGGATAREALHLIDELRTRVLLRTRVALELEVKVV